MRGIVLWKSLSKVAAAAALQLLRLYIAISEGIRPAGWIMRTSLAMQAARIGNRIAAARCDAGLAGGRVAGQPPAALP